MRDTPARWLTRDAVAQYLSIRADKLTRLVKAGRIPTPSYRLGPKSPLWDREVLDAFICGEIPSRKPEVPLSEAVNALASQILREGSRRPRRP